MDNKLLRADGKFVELISYDMVKQEFHFVVIDGGVILGLVSQLLLEDDQNLHIKVYFSQDDGHLVAAAELVITVDELLHLLRLLTI